MVSTETKGDTRMTTQQSERRVGLMPAPKRADPKLSINREDYRVNRPICSKCLSREHTTDACNA